MTEIIVQPDPETTQIVIESEAGTVVVETDGPTQSVVIDTGQEGPPGPPGPAGDGSLLSKVAVGAIGGHRVVIASGADGAALADKDTPAHMFKVLGITTGAAVNGASVEISVFGEVTEPSWSWSEGPVWLGNNGLLTQTLPSTGFQLMIGTAIAPTVLMLKIGAPISLS